jgi:hypothetical protein
VGKHAENNQKLLQINQFGVMTAYKDKTHRRGNAKCRHLFMYCISSILIHTGKGWGES